MVGKNEAPRGMARPRADHVQRTIKVDILLGILHHHCFKMGRLTCDDSLAMLLRMMLGWCRRLQVVVGMDSIAEVG